MATRPALAPPESRRLSATRVATVENLRVLAWNQRTLYASRGYTLLAAQPEIEPIVWREIARFRPHVWRSVSSRNSLGSRLFRDGFHALSVHPRGNLIAALPRAIAALRAGEPEFQISHRITRGTRPLHITATPAGQIFWGEYFDNPDRDAVHIYASDDGGLNWQIAHTFPRRSIRHVHNIVYDRWENCLWIFTGDYGRECRILRASSDFSVVDEVLAGNQQARAVAAVITDSGLFFASDTPLEQNYIYHLDRRGRMETLQPISSSSIYGCRNRTGIYFSTMIEPSTVNRSRRIQLLGGLEAGDWNVLASWKKDRWPMRLFQYGNALLPDGDNSTDLLAATTVAVEGCDFRTTIWRTAGM